MKATVKTIIGVIFGLVILVVIGLVLFNSGIKNIAQLRAKISHAANAETYLMRVDSIRVEYGALKRSYDSLVSKGKMADIKYQAQLAAERDKMKQYKRKISEYEARISAIDGMSYAALLDSIAGYYGRRVDRGR